MGQVTHALDLDHRHNLAMLSRVENALAEAAPGAAAPGGDFRRIATAFAEHLLRDLPRHFEFEERSLFPRLEEAGDGELAALLLEEHVAIRAVIAELVPLLRAAGAGTLDAAGARELRRATQELAERENAHIGKETAALLPALDDALDADADRSLAFEYAAA
jgi:hemerythrin-like domain-containing protein